MSRVKTEHRLVNEGRTGRIVARRALRRGLGNPKKRNRDLAELMQEMFFKGIQQGKQLENLRITYATAGLTYPSEYAVVVEPVADPVISADLGDVIPGSADLSSLPESESSPA